MGNRAEYVKTGNSWLTRTANKLSLLPGGLGSAAAASVGTLAVAWDSAKWLFRGKIGSAATELVTGVVGHGINAINPLQSMDFGGILWWGGAKVGTAAATGSTLGTHGRKIAEDIVGGITGALGIKPKVLQSYPAGIGAMPGASSYYAEQGPGYWATRAAQQQGVDPRARYAQYAAGEGRDHVEALRNAAAMNAGQYRGA